MYLKIELENIDSEETKTTLQHFYGISSGSILSSNNSYYVGKNNEGDVFFWYIDDKSTNEDIEYLKSFSGIKNITIF